MLLITYLLRIFDHLTLFTFSYSFFYSTLIANDRFMFVLSPSEQLARLESDGLDERCAGLDGLASDGREEGSTC
jgi:hypothetical protein